VVAFVEQDEVKEVVRQVLEPAVFLALELLDVGQHNVGFLKVGPVSHLAPDFGGLGIGLAVQDAAFDVEHVRARRIEVIKKLFGDLHAGSYDKGAGDAKSEGRNCDAAGFAAADREDNSDFALRLVRVPSELDKFGICFPLRYAESRVVGNCRDAGLK